MPFIEFCIRNPVKVTVGVLLIGLFGLIALFATPIQLIPNIDQPLVTVSTSWPGASPQEIEREIVDKQEEKLKSLADLREMRSTSALGRGDVTLEFNVGVDRNAVLVDVQNKLKQVGRYPEQVDEPTVTAADAGMDSPIAWLTYRPLPGATPRALADERDWIEDVVKPMIERVPGVASVDIYGGRPREMKVLVDPHRLAARGLTVTQVVDALRNENVNTTAGRVFEGKREYMFRTVGEYSSPTEILNTVIGTSPGGGPVYVRDVADVHLGFKKPTSMVRYKGEDVLTLPVRRQFGSNVMEVMGELKTVLADLNERLLKPRGMVLLQTYDETVYIDQSVKMVTDALWQGGILVVLVLLVFLRSWKSTLVTAVSIPTAAVATFIFVQATGRTLNVISLAGIAFAIGMLVDNSIVVVENIFRHRQMGKDRLRAALDGASEVWMAILASTATTLIVFLPVLFVQEEAGQLFRDVALAICAAIALSLVVAVTVVPAMAARLVDPPKGWVSVGESAEDVHSKAGGRPGAILGAILEVLLRRGWAGAATVLALTGLSLLGILTLTPAQSYLPAGNRNQIGGAIVTPPGYSIEEFRRIGIEIENKFRRYWQPEYAAAYWKWKEETGADVQKAGPYGLVTATTAIGPPPAPGQPPAATAEYVIPPIEHFQFVANQGGAFMRASSADSDLVRPLAQLMQQELKVPGAMAFLRQTSLFGRSLGGANAVDLRISGLTMAQVKPVALAAMNVIRGKYGNPRPSPSNFALGGPEQRLVPDREKLSEVGMNARQMATVASAAVDGAYAGDYRYEGRSIDLVVQFDKALSAKTQDVPTFPLVTPSGGVTTLDSLVKLSSDEADQQITRVEELPTVTLTVLAPEGEPTETTIANIEREVIAPMRAQGLIPDNVVIPPLAGTADKFTEIRRAMFGRWTGFNHDSLLSLLTSRMFLALLVCYLVMAGLYESWVYPFVIMFSVPFGIIGGVLLLQWVSYSTLWSVSKPVQLLDMLTVLGFVILVGTVVNNAILVVYQSLAYLKAGLSPVDAVVTATRTRLRPIFMTTLTTLFGLLPLVVNPGAGSELYRGIGAVLLGGLLTSTVFTLVVVPVVFYLVFQAKRWLYGRLGWTLRELAA